MPPQGTWGGSGPRGHVPREHETAENPSGPVWTVWVCCGILRLAPVVVLRMGVSNGLVPVLPVCCCGGTQVCWGYRWPVPTCPHRVCPGTYWLLWGPCHASPPLPRSLTGGASPGVLLAAVLLLLPLWSWLAHLGATPASEARAGQALGDKEIALGVVQPHELGVPWAAALT